MDSLTQLVLGAAVGEVALGRKIGNRALIWGAIGGTIPDLDVFAGAFMSDMGSLAFHRAITHSIFFSLVAPLAFGSLVQRLYGSRFHASKGYKAFVAILNILLLGVIVVALNYAFRHSGIAKWWVLSVTSALTFLLLWRLYRHYWNKELEDIQTTFKEWYFLFFLALATHWLLDCFTAFGTQIFQPFSNYRVAFNNIAVVDPLYTLPFLICIIVVSFLRRNTKKRALFLWLGIGISSLYMLLTILTKFYVDHVFDKALANRRIETIRTRSTPTIFNNILWSCVAEGKNNYYVGLYSLFDSDPNLHYISVLPKNDSIRQVFASNPDYQTLEWFSNGYLAAFPTDSALYLCDIRYGGMQDTVRSQKDLVFSFKVTEENGAYVFREHREPFPDNMGDVFRKFWIRIKGY